MQSLLFALVPSREEVAAIGDYVVLSLKVDADILVPGPIPLRQSPVALRAEDLKRLQENSRFLEMDLSPARILDIKDPWGNSVAGRYRASERGKLPIWRFLAYLNPYWRFVALATVAGIVKFLAPLVFPWMLRVMLDEVALNQTLSTELRWEKTLLVNGIWMLACYYRSVWAAFAGHRMIRDLRVALFDHVQRLSHSFFTRNQSGAIVSRVVHDLNLAQNFVGSALTNVWMDSVLLLVLVTILLSIHPMLTAVSLLLMPIYVISLRVVGSRIRLISREAQQRLEILSASVQEKVMGVGIVKAFTRES
ncbi:MAG: ABC transporter ATP-binding protein, partial [Gammaproteobacteria bacterium]